MATGGTRLPPVTASPVVFARNFFRSAAEGAPMTNLVVSPAAARSAMTLVFMGARGPSADELRDKLILGVAKKPEIAKQHADFWSKECTCAEKGVALRLVTRLYVGDKEVVKHNFNETALEFFNAQADGLDFLNPDASTKKVNRWLERQTFYTVRNLLPVEAVNPEASVILVNSLFFRAKWSKPFPLKSTVVEDFKINIRQRMELPMMRQIGQFRYGESKKLKSQIIQLPFEESNLTMMLILPKDVDGLRQLEEMLGQLDMNEVAARTKMQEVDVTIPKFRIVSDIDMRIPLQKMGINQIFEVDKADLGDLFAKKKPQSISEARHKLFLNVNEVGCETAPETDAHQAKVKKNPNRKVFKADHPFVFAIRNYKTVYFVGHLAKG
ncbi:hypothetical protein KR018_002881 [Drosophila ironensis]|nr:hypothetical protein KR018_002881 [Drosophila ironensis]